MPRYRRTVMPSRDLSDFSGGIHGPFLRVSLSRPSVDIERLSYDSQYYHTPCTQIYVSRVGRSLSHCSFVCRHRRLLKKGLHRVDQGLTELRGERKHALSRVLAPNFSLPLLTAVLCRVLQHPRQTRTRPGYRGGARR